MLTPCENPFCFGFDTVVEGFQKDILHNQLAHGWIFSGPQGMGKRTLSFALTRQLLQCPDDSLHPTFRQIAAGTHPDVFNLEEPTIEAVRGLHAFLEKRTIGGGWRVCLLPNADQLTRSAMNALLKRLEDPPPLTVFFLTTRTLHSLLPTLRSRCRLIHLKAPSLPTFEMALTRMASLQKIPFNLEDIASLYPLVQGCLGKAVVALAENTPSLTGQLTQLFSQGLIESHHPLFAPPFTQAHDPVWRSLSPEILADFLRHWIATLCVSGTRGTLDPLQSSVWHGASPDTWVRRLENACAFLEKARIFHLDPLHTAIVVFQKFREMP